MTPTRAASTRRRLWLRRCGRRTRLRERWPRCQSSRHSCTDSGPAAVRLASEIDKLVGRLMFDRDIWRDAQAVGLPWAPIRRPEENAVDEHWLRRESFFPVDHPELDETFMYTGAKWVTEGMAWPRG